MAILTKKYVIAIGAVACLAIAGLGVNYAVLPTVASVQEAQMNISDAETSRDAMQSRLSGLQNAQAQFPKIEAVNTSLTAQFPETGQTQQLLDQIFQGASQNGMSTSQIKNITFEPPKIVTPVVAAPTTPATGDAAASPSAVTPDSTVDSGTGTGTSGAAQTALPEGFATLGFSMSLEGSADQVRGYLDYLNNLDRVVSIKEYTVSEAGEGVFTLAFSATTYVYRAIATPSAPVNPADLEQQDSGVVTEQ